MAFGREACCACLSSISVEFPGRYVHRHMVKSGRPTEESRSGCMTPTE